MKATRRIHLRIDCNLVKFNEEVLLSGNILDKPYFTPLEVNDKTPPPTPFLPSYFTLRQFYLKHGVTLQRQKLLKRVSLKVPLALPKKKVFGLVNWVADLLLLNEIEIVQWFSLLETTSKPERSINTKMVLLFTGFLAKLTLSKHSETIEEYLVAKFPNFKLDFQNWQLVSECCAEVNWLDLNKKLRTLKSSSKAKTDYQELVDQLMPSKKSCEKSESPTLGNLKQELEAFETHMLGGEKLTPIDM